MFESTRLALERAATTGRSTQSLLDGGFIEAARYNERGPVDISSGTV